MLSKKTEICDFRKYYDALIEQSQKDIEVAQLFKIMCRKAEEYVAIRRQWEHLSVKELCRKNTERSALHDIFMLSLQDLVRHIEPEVHEKLPDKYSTNRKIAGDFAEYLVQKKENLEQRMHILCAINQAQKHSDRVLSVINDSCDMQTAKRNIQNLFGFQEDQAQAIVDMRLRAFFGREKEQIAVEIRELHKALELFP